MKEKALSTAAKTISNRYIHEYGKINQIHVDTKKQSISLELQLHGESDTIAIAVEHYEISADNNIIFSGLVSSRAWLDVILAKYIESREFQIPSEYATILRSIT